MFLKMSLLREISFVKASGSFRVGKCFRFITCIVFNFIVERTTLRLTKDSRLKTNQIKCQNLQ